MARKSTSSAATMNTTSTAARATRTWRSRLSIADAISESVSSAFARPGRAALTALGTMLGITTLVATVGLSRTAGFQIVDRFDELAATQVDVRPADTGAATQEADELTQVIPWDAEVRLDRLAGVVNAGTISEIDLGGEVNIASVPVNDPELAVQLPPTVVAASPGALAAVRSHLLTGRFFDGGHSARADRVAIIGIDAANSLGIDRVDTQPFIFINDELFAVIGIVDDVEREGGLLDAIVIPDGTAQKLFALTAPARVIVDTKLGASALIARQAPLALAPNNPERVVASPAWEPSGVKRGIESDVTSLLLLLGGISLLVGVIGIANVTLVSVLERVGEIGLRRALGAGRRHIASQFLMESAALGLLAGIIGSSFGVVAVVIVSAMRDWTPVLDVWLPPAAAVVGAVAGLLAGLYPAMRAARLEPVDALRAGM